MYPQRHREGRIREERERNGKFEKEKYLQVYLIQVVKCCIKQSPNPIPNLPSPKTKTAHPER